MGHQEVDISPFQARCEHPEPSTQTAHGIVVEARAPPLSSQACESAGLEADQNSSTCHPFTFQLNMFLDADAQVLHVAASSLV